MEHADEMRWISAVAATLRAERGVADLTQAEVSRRTGVARTSYRLYEEGKRQPDVVTLAKIAEAFKIPLSRLFAEAERRANDRA